MTEERQIVQEQDVPEIEIEEAYAPEVETPEASPEPEWSSEDAEEARLFGWKDDQEFKGEKPEGYIADPREYMERVQRSRIFQAMQQKLDDAQTSAAEQARKMQAVTKAAVERQKADYERELEKIRQDQRAAVEVGDTDAYDAAEKRRAELQAPQDVDPEPEKPKVDPYITEYMATENGAWLNNPILRDAAAKLVGANQAVLAGSVQDQVAYAEAEIRKMYPSYFPQQERSKPRAVVDGGGLAGGRLAKDAFSKLPEDAKSTFNQQVKDGLFEDTKEDREWFANEYNAA